MLIKYQCNLCDNEIKKLYQSKDKQPPFLTCECGGAMQKQMPEFSTSSLEIVDTGSMARKVELRKDAVERFREKGDKYIKNLESRDRILKKDEN